jgi:Domain of unknown function (DUF4388)
MLRQYIIATRLVSIIRAIQLSRETGMLIAKRGEGNSAEEGRIVFANGRIAEVKVNRPNISEAFNHMSTWENCLVSFISQDPSKTTTSMFENLPTLVSGPPEGQKLEIPSTPLPKGARPVRDPRPKQPYDPPVSNPSSNLSPTEQELMSYVPLLTQSLPGTLRQIEQLGLSRAHRQLILLIDGKRSVEDLTHAMGRTLSNVQEILYDLIQLRMI